MSKTADEHKIGAPTSLNFTIITISTSRYEMLQKKEETEDISGDLIIDLLHEVGHSVINKEIVSDDKYAIKKSLQKAIRNKKGNAIITCGGTGITPTDITIETISPLLEKSLPGFGEIFRAISYDSIGSSAILTRATAGLIKGKAIFCLPGSPQAVETALKKLIIPEVGHIVKHASNIK